MRVHFNMLFIMIADCYIWFVSCCFSSLGTTETWLLHLFLTVIPEHFVAQKESLLPYMLICVWQWDILWYFYVVFDSYS